MKILYIVLLMVASLGLAACTYTAPGATNGSLIGNIRITPGNDSVHIDVTNLTPENRTNATAALANVIVMKHVCDSNIQSQVDFDAMQAGLDPVAAHAVVVQNCPAVGLVTNAPMNNTIAGDRAGFDFQLTASNGSTYNISSASFVQDELCGATINNLTGALNISNETCYDESYYAYPAVNSGMMTVKETSPVEGTRFGTVTFTPNALSANNDNDSLVSVDNNTATISLNTTNDTDGTIMLHVFDFVNLPPANTTVVQSDTTTFNNFFQFFQNQNTVIYVLVSPNASPAIIHAAERIKSRIGPNVQIENVENATNLTGSNIIFLGDVCINPVIANVTNSTVCSNVVSSGNTIVNLTTQSNNNHYLYISGNNDTNIVGVTNMLINGQINTTMQQNITNMTNETTPNVIVNETNITGNQTNVTNVTNNTNTTTGTNLSVFVSTDDTRFMNALDFFIGGPTTYILIGDNASSSSSPAVTAASDLQSTIGSNSQVMVVSNSTDISNITGSDLVILGNACNNAAASALLNTADCSTLAPNTAYINLMTVGSSHRLYIFALDDATILDAVTMLRNGQVTNVNT